MGRSGIIEPSDNDLRDLLAKYDLLLQLSEREGRTRERRDAMRQIAERFPGALREWDALGREDLARRRAEVLSALSGGAPAPWMAYAIDLHACLREVLAIRAWLSTHASTRAAEDRAPSRARLLDEALLGACVEAFAARGLAQPPDLERVRLVASPPSGRLALIAYREVARRHGVTVEALKAALFMRPAPR